MRKRNNMQKVKGMARCKWCGIIGTTAICRTHVPYCTKNPNRIKTIDKNLITQDNMETVNIKTLEIEIKYKVGLGGIEMPQKVYEQLLSKIESYKELSMGDLDCDEAQQWIQQNIHEQDCFDWNAEIIELETDETPNQ